MTKTQIEVITSVQRRRSWSRAEKERIVAAAMEPGAVASEVARAAGIHTSQLFRWRQQLCERTQVPATFNSVNCAGARSSICASGSRESRRDRDRVCDRRPDADHWNGRCANGDGADEGAGERQASAIVSSTRTAAPRWRRVLIGSGSLIESVGRTGNFLMVHGGCRSGVTPWWTIGWKRSTGSLTRH